MFRSSFLPSLEDEVAVRRVRAELLGLGAEASLLRFVLLHRKYNPDQPRIPAGESGGGRWTDGSGAGADGRIRLAQNGPPRLPRSTATTRLGGRPLEGTSGQLTEWVIADAQARVAVESVRQIDPRWRPPESLTETIEGEIDAAKSTLEAARARLVELGDPQAQEERLGVCIRPEGEWIGEQVKTSKETTRTVSQEEFRDLTGRLLNGAIPLESRGSYQGREFLRSDGTIFGLRWSPVSDFTIDILLSRDTLIKNGTKVHFK